MCLCVVLVCVSTFCERQGISLVWNSPSRLAGHKAPGTCLSSHWTLHFHVASRNRTQVLGFVRQVNHVLSSAFWWFTHSHFLISSPTAPATGSAAPVAVGKHVGKLKLPTIPTRRAEPSEACSTDCLHRHSASLLSTFAWWKHILSILFSNETARTLLTPHPSAHSCQVQSHGSQ